MKTKSELPSILPALADVAFIDAPRIAAAACLSLSTWHELVRTGQAPQPAFRAPRCTRWRLTDVREWLRQRAGQANEQGAEAVMRAARKGSEAARAKRQRADIAPSEGA